MKANDKLYLKLEEAWGVFSISMHTLQKSQSAQCE